MRLNTQEVALLIGCSTGEIAHALEHDSLVKGVQLPQPTNRQGQTRQFDYQDVVDAVAARVGNSCSVKLGC